MTSAVWGRRHPAAPIARIQRDAEIAAQRAADDAANRQIMDTLFTLPPDVERQIGGHLYAGMGVRGLERLHEALRLVQQGQHSQPGGMA